MEDPYGNAPSKHHLLFSRNPSNSGNITVLSSIKSIWEDKYIENLKDNQWKCLSCDVTFQGLNATKVLAHVIGTKSMHISEAQIQLIKIIYQDIRSYSKYNLPRKVLEN